MENKAPGTTPRPGGYESAASDNFFHPKPKMKKSIQRAGLRTSRKVVYWMCGLTMVFIGVPMHLGPMWVSYVTNIEWVRKVSDIVSQSTQSMWARRNQKDWDLFMTQRRNSWFELLGLKRYNIGGDDNIGDVQKYRKED